MAWEAAVRRCKPHGGAFVCHLPENPPNLKLRLVVPAGFRRPHHDRRDDRPRALPIPGFNHRRRGRRSVRQSGPLSRPRLSRRADHRSSGHRRRQEHRAVPSGHDVTRARLLVQRPARRAVVTYVAGDIRRHKRRYRRLVPGCGGRCAGRQDDAGRGPGWGKDGVSRRGSGRQLRTSISFRQGRR
ncbi:UNVERIFIED_CONTAM: hypothetical protein GTU68_057543 [Idotea baltica]|nr:hypothetical protein [Idotea baltica]